MKSCIGRVADNPNMVEDENDIDWRKSVWFREWEEHDPLERHWPLGPICVLPSHRDIGVATALVQPFCKEVDNCQAKVYLETDLDESVRFYEKFGFNLISSSNNIQSVRQMDTNSNIVATALVTIVRHMLGERGGTEAQCAN